MTEFGVTRDGFRVKPFLEILSDKAARAREIFGADADLHSGSTLRKILEIAAAEDQELWKRMEQLYYSSFISTASGDALDLLGEDLGSPRRLSNATGEVRLKLTNGAPGRTYHIPLGTLVETDAPVQRFRTIELVSLTAEAPEAVVGVVAITRGPAANVAASAINKINAAFIQQKLNLGVAQVTVKNDVATAGGDVPEGDEPYRTLLLARPRALWTVESVRAAAAALDGVRDVRVFDPSGGVDVSLSKFRLFRFSGRRFGTQRFIGTPYFFDVLVAVAPGFPWLTTGGVIGVKDAVEAAIRDVRPISIFPNVRPANEVSIGVRAKVLLQPGHDAKAALAAIRQTLEARVNATGLGNAILYAEVVCDIMNLPGVVDVQQLHLRRNPPRMATIAFGRSERFGGDPIEVAIGENVLLRPDEIGIFSVDSRLVDIEVSDR